MVTLFGIEACPLSEWLCGALIESGFQTVCMETRHAQRFLSSRPDKSFKDMKSSLMLTSFLRTLSVSSRAKGHDYASPCRALF
jgi:transposase